MTFLLLADSRFVMPPTADVGVSAPPRIAAAAVGRRERTAHGLVGPVRRLFRYFCQPID